MKTIQFTLDSGDHQVLKRFALDNRISIGDLLRSLVSDFVQDVLEAHRSSSASGDITKQSP